MKTDSAKYRIENIGIELLTDFFSDVGILTIICLISG